MNVKVLRNLKKPWTKSIVDELIIYLKSKNIKIVSSKADVTICVGGDGTILYFNHTKNIQGSIVGLGTRTSYLCQVRKDNWKTKILPLLINAEKEPRITLTATIQGKKFSAINDVVLHTVDYRVITTTIQVNDAKRSFQGDGVIISTPTGSTAYAYSAGGLVIDEAVKAIEIVPICPYKRAFSPTIFNDDHEITISSDRLADLTIDGIYIKQLKPNEQVYIKKGKNVHFLV